MTDKQCPKDKPSCIKNCAWHMDGKCAMVVIAESLAVIAKSSDDKKGGKR